MEADLHWWLPEFLTSQPAALHAMFTVISGHGTEEPIHRLPATMAGTCGVELMINTVVLGHVDPAFAQRNVR